MRRVIRSLLLRRIIRPLLRVVRLDVVVVLSEISTVVGVYDDVPRDGDFVSWVSPGFGSVVVVFFDRVGSAFVVGTVVRDFVGVII